MFYSSSTKFVFKAITKYGHIIFPSTVNRATYLNKTFFSNNGILILTVVNNKYVWKNIYDIIDDTIYNVSDQNIYCIFDKDSNLITSTPNTLSHAGTLNIRDSIPYNNNILRDEYYKVFMYLFLVGKFKVHYYEVRFDHLYSERSPFIKKRLVNDNSILFHINRRNYISNFNVNRGYFEYILNGISVDPFSLVDIYNMWCEYTGTQEEFAKEYPQIEYIHTSLLFLNMIVEKRRPYICNIYNQVSSTRNITIDKFTKKRYSIKQTLEVHKLKKIELSYDTSGRKIQEKYTDKSNLNGWIYNMVIYNKNGLLRFNKRSGKK